MLRRKKVSEEVWREMERFEMKLKVSGEEMKRGIRGVLMEFGGKRV
jgi:hypothetical protein